jgi:hypothetical protein
LAHDTDVPEYPAFSIFWANFKETVVSVFKVFFDPDEVQAAG